jgi:myo-inositol-1-phosphate synthase
MVESNSLLYKPILESPGGEKQVGKGDKKRETEHPDHCVSVDPQPLIRKLQNWS